MLIDIKQAAKGLRRGAGPLVVSALSLSLGIAATATMLSVVDAIDFRPMPFHDAHELVDLSEANPARPGFLGRVSPGVYLDWKERSESVASMVAASSIVVSLGEGGEGLDAVRVSEEFFSTLGLQPLLGRVFGADEVEKGARVAVISHEVWRSRFGGDPQVIGRTVPLSWAGEFRSVPAEPYTVVGVLPPAVRFPLGSEVWIPAAGGFGESRRDPFLTVTGRLDEGSSLEEVRAELEVISANLAADFPKDYESRVARVSALRDTMRAWAEERGAAARFPLLGIAAFVLLLAVLNVSGLFLARAAAQVRELRVRLALGATRSRVGTLLLTQSLILALAAGALSIVISYWLIELVSSKLQVAESGTALVLDGRFVGVALVLSLVSGVLVALLPVWRLSRLEQRAVLDGVSARSTGIARSGRTQRSMVVGQVALAVVLLSGAGVLSAEYLHLVGNQTGFDPERLLVASLPISMTASPEEAIAQARQTGERIDSLSGISSAAVGGLPAEGYSYSLDDGSTLKDGRRPMSYRSSPGYFATLGVRLEAGREFTASDREASVPVGIVNRLAADLWWPNENPIGKGVYMATPDGVGQWVRIIGVVDNERVMRSMTSEMRPVLYRPFDQLTGERRRARVFARTESRPEAAFRPVSRTIEQVYGEGGWRGEGVVTMESMLGSTLAEQRFRAWALSGFSAIALLLAAMGIYGVVATMVAQRTAEIGVRIALGARPVQVLSLVSRQGVGLAIAGFVLGVAGSVAMSRILQSLLVSATGFDLRMPLAAGLVLACTALVACYVPAQRAAQIDPVSLLRDV